MAVMAEQGSASASERVLLSRVAELCLPTILGTGVFCVLGLLQQRSVAIDVGWFNPVAMAVVLTSFLCAGYGPLLIPVAAILTLVEQRHAGRDVGLCWLLILLALAATVLGYGWALDAVELP